MKKLQSTRLVLFLCLVLYILLTLVLTFNGFIYTANNIWISLMITVMFVTGLWMLYRLYAKLAKEEKAVDTLTESDIKTTEDLLTLKDELTGSWISKRIQQIARLANLNATIDEQKMQQILAEEFKTSGNLVRFIASSIVFVGLLGTFLGIIQSAQGFDAAFSSGSAAQPYENVSAIIGGLDKALGTSIVGIIASLILSLMVMAVKNYQHSIVMKLEEASMLNILPYFKQEESHLMTRILTESIENVLPRVLRQAMENLKFASEDLRLSTKSIATMQNSVEDLITNVKMTVLQLDKSNQTLGNNLIDYANNTHRIKQSLQNLNAELTQNREIFSDLAVLNKRSNESLLNIGHQTELSHQKFENYVHVKEKLFEELLVRLNMTMRKLITDVNVLLEESTK